MCPYTGIEIGQQLQAYTQFIGFSLREFRHLFVHLSQNACEVFHMVTHLVGNHIGIGKVAICTQLLLHRGEERQVDIQFLVTWAIEGTHCGRTLSAGCCHTTRIKHHLRHLVLCTLLAEYLCPHIFRTSKNLCRELGQLLFFLSKLRLILLYLRITSKGILLHLLHNSRYGIASREPCKEGYHNDTTDTKTGLCATAHSTAVFHIRAFASSV